MVRYAQPEGGGGGGGIGRPPGWWPRSSRSVVCGGVCHVSTLRCTRGKQVPPLVGADTLPEFAQQTREVRGKGRLPACLPSAALVPRCSHVAPCGRC